jgi:hypothetical protein
MKTEAAIDDKSDEETMVDLFKAFGNLNKMITGFGVLCKKYASAIFSMTEVI